jgi:hypothetical protein
VINLDGRLRYKARAWERDGQPFRVTVHAPTVNLGLHAPLNFIPSDGKTTVTSEAWASFQPRTTALPIWTLAREIVRLRIHISVRSMPAVLQLPRRFHTSKARDPELITSDNTAAITASSGTDSEGMTARFHPGTAFRLSRLNSLWTMSHRRNSRFVVTPVT